MFGLTIDLTFWSTFIDLPLGTQAGIVIALGGWVPLAIFFFKAGSELWIKYRQNKYTSSWKWVLLAVDIPPLFIQTPKAVEQIFAQISGTESYINVRDKFWTGKKQKWFSFEIISIEGYIQFLIRTELEFRDLVEAAIYAQYTEAQITEVEDYVNNIPSHYPDVNYDVLGVEFKLDQPDYYPIRTYPHFQYNLSKDAVFSDPMAAILENFTRISKGENLWMQLIIEPTGSGWKQAGIDQAKEIMSGGPAHGHGGGIADFLVGIPSALLKELTNIISWNFEGGHEEHEVVKRVELTPGTKTTVEAIEEKVSRIGFKSKMRLLYASNKSVYSPNRCIEGFVGSMNQFHVSGRNGIVPYMATHAHYDNSSHTKSTKLKDSLVKVFKDRKMKWKLCDGYILSIEELATIWHFPLPFVKTPLLQRADHKKGEPPSGLPTESSEKHLQYKGLTATSSVVAEPEPVDAPPEDLPFA